MGDENTVSCCDTAHPHSGGAIQGTGRSTVRLFLPAIISFLLLLLGLAFDNAWLACPPFFEGWMRLAWYGIAYLPVGGPVIREMFQAFAKGDLFSEFTLMTIATLGAFFIGEYPEGVAVMLFYSVGENLQGLAVRR